MNSPNSSKPHFEDSKIDTKIKLAALWASITFCYIYGDYFELYTPGKLGSMLAGKMGPLGAVTQEILVGTSIMMAIPSLMVFLSLVIKPAVSRWINILFGTAFTIIMLLAIQGTWRFYQFFGIVEIILTASVVWHAWKWPRTE